MLRQQLLQERTALALEREKAVQGSRAFSHQTQEQMQAMRSEILQLQQDLKLSNNNAKEWEDKATAAVKAMNEKSADPTCNDSTLRSMITSEVMAQLKTAQNEVHASRLRAESLEIENKTYATLLIRFKETGGSNNSVTSAGDATDMDSSFTPLKPFATPLRSSRERNVGEAVPSSPLPLGVKPMDLSSIGVEVDVEEEYKHDIDEFDRLMGARKKGDRNGTRRVLDDQTEQVSSTDVLRDLMNLI